MERRGKYFHRRSRTLYPEKGGPTGHLMVISIVCTVTVHQRREGCAKGTSGTSRDSEAKECWTLSVGSIEKTGVNTFYWEIGTLGFRPWPALSAKS